MINEDKLKDILPELSFNVLKKFVAKWKDHEDLAGILLCGSYIHGDAGKNADLDIHIVLTKTDNWRKRGNIVEEGIEVEYFINPVKQIEQYFKSEYPNGKNTADMFVNSIILENKSPEFEILLSLASEYMNKELPNLSDDDIYSFKYILDDLRKDLDDTVNIDDEIAFYLIFNTIINECLTIFAKVNKIYLNKSKRLIKTLEKNNKCKIFTSLLKNAIKANISINTLEKKYKIIIELINYCESLIGGARPDEYSFESSSNY